MPRSNPIIPAFNAGEFSPRMAARVDFAKYPLAGDRLENFLPLPQGLLGRRPGTRFIKEAGDSTVRHRLLPFVFSTEQAYVVEASDAMFRFYRNKGQITVADTDAAITNGTFNTDIAGWTDQSTGAASISFNSSTTVEEGTFGQARTADKAFGDAVVDAANAGLMFTNTTAGTVTQVRFDTGSPLTAAGACVAKLYTNSSGSPGTQVGGDSDSVSVNTASTTYTFTWSASAPTLSAATNYWVVITNTDATLDTDMAITSDQGVGFASGMHDTITSIADASGSFPSGNEHKIGVTILPTVANGAMALNGVASETAWAEQSVTTTSTGQEHVLAFRVIGDSGDTVKLRVGTASTAVDLINDLELGVGWHDIAVTPTASPFYVQFLNETAKAIEIDDVALFDNAPLSLTTPYLEAELPALKFAQTADVLYIAHPNHPILKLERRGHTSWSLVEVAWEDGPYLNVNTGATTFQPAAATGIAVTITATDTVGINNDDGFLSTDVGRVLRIKNGTDWGWGVIVEFVSSTQVKVDIKRAFAATSAATDWTLGAWSATTGYPSGVTFFEQRLVAFSTRGDVDGKPQTIWFSQSADIENMRPDTLNETAIEVQDDDGFDFEMAADQVNVIRWVSPGTQLIIGTTGGEWVAKSDGPILKPADIDVKRSTTHGSADIAPARVSHVVLYLQRAKRKIRELAFNFDVNDFRSPDMTILSDHILTSGVEEIAYQQEPDSLLWCVRSDGQLAVLTYLREQDVTAWSRHVLGGSFAGGDPVVESVATIPGNAATGTENQDETWVIVKRTVNAVTRRFVEVFEPIFEGPGPQEYDSVAAFKTAIKTAQKDAHYVDSGLIYDGAATASFSGLDHLEGETVKIWADGAVQPDKTVTAGAVTLDAAASKVRIGLGYRHKHRGLKLNFGAAAGTAVGRKKRISAVTFVLLHATRLGQGASFDTVRVNDFRQDGDPLDEAVPLFTGEHRVSFDGDWDEDARIVIDDDAPGPFFLEALVPEIKTNEMS